LCAPQDQEKARQDALKLLEDTLKGADDLLVGSAQVGGGWWGLWQMVQAVVVHVQMGAVGDGSGCCRSCADGGWGRAPGPVTMFGLFGLFGSYSDLSAFPKSAPLW